MDIRKGYFFNCVLKKCVSTYKWATVDAVLNFRQNRGQFDDRYGMKHYCLPRSHFYRFNHLLPPPFYPRSFRSNTFSDWPAKG